MTTKEKVLSFRFTWVSLILFTVAAVAVWYTFTQYIQLSSLAMFAAYLAMAVPAAGIVDNVLLRRIDSFKMLHESPVGYAIVYASYVLLIGMCALASSG